MKENGAAGEGGRNVEVDGRLSGANVSSRSEFDVVVSGNDVSIQVS